MASLTIGPHHIRKAHDEANGYGRSRLTQLRSEKPKNAKNKRRLS